jgi:uncharacterized damage-inducible protein DinB
MKISMMSHQLEPTMLEFFHYNHWANQELMMLCTTLHDDLITSTIPGSYGSIHMTFVHILKAEISFLKRTLGTYPEPPFTWDAPPSFTHLMAYETTLHEALLDMLQRVSATHHVHEAGDGWTFDYHSRLIFMSVVYHGIAHRTDITTALTHHGIRAPELDVWGYQAAYPDRFQASVVRTGY